jgi:hypothetical protein
MNDWQPIDTAPTDGTPILSLSKNGAGQWCTPAVIKWGNGWETAAALDVHTIVYHPPLLWMPLPESPSPLPGKGL